MHLPAGARQEDPYKQVCHNPTSPACPLCDIPSPGGFLVHSDASKAGNTASRQCKCCYDCPSCTVTQVQTLLSHEAYCVRVQPLTILSRTLCQLRVCHRPLLPSRLHRRRRRHLVHGLCRCAHKDTLFPPFQLLHDWKLIWPWQYVHYPPALSHTVLG